MFLFKIRQKMNNLPYEVLFYIIEFLPLCSKFKLRHYVRGNVKCELIQIIKKPMIKELKELLWISGRKKNVLSNNLMEMHVGKKKYYLSKATNEYMTSKLYEDGLYYFSDRRFISIKFITIMEKHHQFTELIRKNYFDNLPFDGLDKFETADYIRLSHGNTYYYLSRISYDNIALKTLSGEICIWIGARLFSHSFVNHICKDLKLRDSNFYTKMMELVNKKDTHFDPPVFKISSSYEFLVNIYKEFCPESNIFTYLTMTCAFVLMILSKY